MLNLFKPIFSLPQKMSSVMYLKKAKSIDFVSDTILNEMPWI